jgi:hypothetical protein
VNKNPSVHGRMFPPLTLAFSGPRIEPLLEVLSPAVNGSSRAVRVNKNPSVHGRMFLSLTLASDHVRDSLSCDAAWMAPPGPHDGSETNERTPGDGPDSDPTHDRPFRSSSRSRSR